MEDGSKKSMPLRSNPDGGHTGQYITLAEGLRQAAEAMEADLAYLEKKGFSTGMTSLRFEARCATIALLSAALCESVANTVLAGVLTKPAYKKIDASMPEKWSRHIPEALECAPPDAETVELLRLLQRTRNSIVHAEATVFDAGEVVHIQGNHGPWDNLTPEMTRKFMQLPLHLSEIISPTAGILYAGIRSSLQERQPRLPRVHIADVLTPLEVLDRGQRQLVRAAIDRMDATEPMLG